MLVVTRKAGERIRIGEEIEITIVRLAGDRVRVGIAAPREVPIRRVDPLGCELRPHHVKRRA